MRLLGSTAPIRSRRLSSFHTWISRFRHRRKLQNNVRHACSMNFPTIALALTFFLVTPGRVLSQEGAPLTPENEIRQLEKDFADAIQTQDSTLVKKFVADDYFLAIGIRGGPLQIVPRNKWILAIKDYVTKSFTIDDIRVHLYGDLAVAILLYSQKAVRSEEHTSEL